MSSPSLLVFLRTSILAAVLSLAGAAGQAESAEELMQKGDAHDVKLEAADALKSYLQAEKLVPRDAQLMVRIARQYRHLMADASSREEKLRLGQTALRYGNRAALLAPNDSHAQLSCAISYGKMVSLQEKGEQVKASVQIRVAAEKARRLDPNNDLAWYILGRWHRVVSEISGVKRALAAMLYEELPPSSNEDAVNCLQKAIAINPGRAIYHLELGQTFAAMGRSADARRFLEKGLSMPNRDKDDPQAKQEGRKVLASLR